MNVMRKIFKLFFILLFIMTACVYAHASTPSTTLQYYSPEIGATIPGTTVTLQWNIHSWDDVKKVEITIRSPKEKTQTFIFKGNEAKRRKHTVTGLKPKTLYIWSISVETIKESGTFGYFPGFSFFTE